VAEKLLAGVSAPPARGAVAPHAGWVYSGPTAAKAVAAIAAAQPETVVLFGATHSFIRSDAALFSSGRWETPFCQLEVDADLAEAVARVPGVVADQRAHTYEHSIEVHLPLLAIAAPGVRILPIMLNFSAAAAAIGRGIAEAIGSTSRRVAYLASTDLTHYGPAFSFEPAGRGPKGLKWAKEVNDRRFIALIAAVAADDVVPEAEGHHNACGAGAVAALLGAMQVLGANAYAELEHTTSAEVRAAGEPDTLNSVGYEAGIFA
jgi:hypothetical protein